MRKAVCKRINKTTSASLLSSSSPKFKTPQIMLLMVAGLLWACTTKAMALETGLPLSQLSIPSMAISTIFALGLVLFLIRHFKINRHYNSVLQKNQRETSALLAASSATWYWDLESDLVTFSPALQTTLDDGKQNTPRDSRVWAYLLHPDDLKHTNQLMQEAQTHYLSQFQYACRLKNNQGKYLSCTVSGSASGINRKGQPSALTGTILFSREETRTSSSSVSYQTSLPGTVAKTATRKPQQTQHFSPDEKHLQNHVTPPGSQTVKQLLIVDDDPFIRQMLSGLLSSMKTNIILASSGEEALSALGEHYIDLVLMDLEMPEMSGQDVLELIRRIRNYDCLPVISMTSGRPRKHLVSIDHSGFNEEISKPIDPQKLKRILKHYLEEEKQVNAKEKTERQEQTPKIMDLDIAMYYVEGNRELLSALLNNIHNDHYHDLEKFRAYRQNHNTHDAQRLLHTLKGIAGTIGATELEESCGTLENQEPYQRDALATFEQAFLVLMKEIEIQNSTKRIRNAQ